MVGKAFGPGEIEALVIVSVEDILKAASSPTALRSCRPLPCAPAALFGARPDFPPPAARTPATPSAPASTLLRLDRRLAAIASAINVLTCSNLPP